MKSSPQWVSGEPSTERAAAVARDVLEAAGLEFRLAKRPDPPVAPPGETDRTHPEPEASDADQGQEDPVSASSRGSQRPQKRRKGRKRTQPPNQPRAPRADAQAAQATPSKPPKTLDERRIAWAWENQDEAAARGGADALASFRNLAEGSSDRLVPQ